MTRILAESAADLQKDQLILAYFNPGDLRGILLSDSTHSTMAASPGPRLIPPALKKPRLPAERSDLIRALEKGGWPRLPLDDLPRWYVGLVLFEEILSPKYDSYVFPD